MRVVSIAPGAAALMQSLRGFGYSAESALADLIDNSIAAGAAHVAIDIAWNEGAPQVFIRDDGAGLDEAALATAMQFGGKGPQAARNENDLGRFGLGLKTASLSQCRRMTVVSISDGHLNALSWDIDEVEARNAWDALVPEILPDAPPVHAFKEGGRGTLVMWERMDAIGGLAGLDKETFFARIQDIRAHFGMVFHRFLSGDAPRVAISVNGRAAQGWDPFLRTHPATITMPTERLRADTGDVIVTPYVLPHRDRFANDAEYESAAGPGGWTERQGFYVYRGRRLVVAGGWLGLGGSRGWTRDEASRLARISVDLSAQADAEWRIDVKKSIARPPGRLRARLTALAGACRQSAREVFAWRGGGRRRGVVRTEAPEELWTPSVNGNTTRYLINREHRAVAALAAMLGDDAAVLDGLLTLIERSVPVERIWLDVSEQSAAAPRLSDDELTSIAGRIAALASRMSGETLFNAESLLRAIPNPPSGLREAVLNALETRDE